ncbi:dihydrofolate reductase family protein [Actinomadura fibrosa]|uniref:Dihydrofolate reductase family protein n=1 Tax=Actinomadura fibrosa TaxID=111802 RepID=A0ABW2XEF3_9ACTN|nr:dihydrofolate reductase family protein [Actinomadura fibrosa]
MRKIVYSMSVSLDGFFEGPERDIGWHRVDEELHGHMNRQFAPMSAFLEGRVTWELMADYWPTADTDPESTETEREFSRIWCDMPKIVYSRTLDRAGWNTTIARDVVVDEVKALKAQPGGDMVVGGADLAATFIRHGLVDEYWIYVHPVAIGQGRTPFPPDAQIPMRLVDTRTFGNGVVRLQYENATGDGDAAS